MNVFCSSGPEGIRTPGLLSAIEARSQLRYRPVRKAKRILPEAFGNVNVETGEIYVVESKTLKVEPCSRPSDSAHSFPS